MLVIFTFVALWHDLSFKLLTWGWLVVIFIIPELLATYLLPATKVSVVSFLVYWQTEAYVLYAVRSILVVQTRMRHRRGIQHPHDVICELGGIRHRYGGDRLHGEGDREFMGRYLARSLLIRSRRWLMRLFKRCPIPGDGVFVSVCWSSVDVRV